MQKLSCGARINTPPCLLCEVPGTPLDKDTNATKSRITHRVGETTESKNA